MDLFQKISEDFPQSAISALIFVILGSLLTSILGYIKTNYENKESRIQNLQDQKLDNILAEIGKLRTDLTIKIDGVDTKLTTEIGKVRTDLTTEIGKIRTDLTTQIEKIDHKVDKLSDDVAQLTVKVAVLDTTIQERLPRNPVKQAA